MRNFKIKTLSTAVLSALSLLSAPSHAVHVNPHGLGQVLIYPYYTVRTAGNPQAGTFNTYLSVVNSANATKAIKIRFREGRGGKPVLDFNAYLSPFDVWTAAVVPVDAADATRGAKLVTADNSCTVPSYRGNEPAFVFQNAAYAANGGDGESASLDRTNEGYFEIIELADLTGTITTGIKHTAAGVPANCAVLGANEANVAAAAVTGSGGLSGTATLINVNNGIAYGYEPVVLDDFRGVGSGPIWTVSGSAMPDLSAVSPKVSRVFASQGLIETDWSSTAASTPADAVSAVLMSDAINNEFLLDASTNSGTDWVLTFPTKYAYVGNDALSASGVRQETAAIRPFERNFWTGGACDEIALTPHDREEAMLVQPPYGVPAPGRPATTVCWAANVYTFKNFSLKPSNLLGSANAESAGVVFIGYFAQFFYSNGTASLAFPEVRYPPSYPGAHAMPAPPGSTKVNGAMLGTGSATYYGLPVVGFGLQSYVNGTLSVGGARTLANYGARFNHKSSLKILTN